jgi:hypothetical protein
MLSRERYAVLAHRTTDVDDKTSEGGRKHAYRSGRPAGPSKNVYGPASANNALCHRSIEAAPMCSSQVLGYDQLDTLAEYLLGRIAKQRGRGLVSANDRSRAVGRDDSVSDVMEYPLGQFGLLFHGST